MRNKAPYGFLLFTLAFLGLFYFIENSNDAFLLNDFKVYYSASEELMNGGEPYGQAFGLSSGYFKYSPVTLFLFSPYTAFDFETAKIIHFMLISLCTIAVLVLCLRMCSEYFGQDLRGPGIFMTLLLLLSSVHLTRELHLGNINMILLLFFLLGILHLHHHRVYLAAFFWVMIIFLKPYFLILVLPLIVGRCWRLLLTMAVYGTILVFLPALILGPEANSALITDWLTTMQTHSDGGFSEHTFSSIFTAYTGIKLPSAMQYLFIGLIMAGYGLVRLPEIRGKRLYNRKKRLFDLFLLLALIPNMVITDSQHFLFSLPLIALVIAHLKGDLKWYLVGAFAVLWFFYGANSNDLLGNPLSDRLDTFSTIGVANIGLVCLLIYLNGRYNREVELSSF